jgi:hypothetical protein
MYYYHVNGETTCSTCKAGLDRAGVGAGGAKVGSGMPKAVLFGLGAAIAGAAIYYAVMEYLDLEIGIVAILIGYMVGHSVHKAINGRGGRRFQVLAAGLTYFAVALAYAPFAIRGMTNPDSVTADSISAVTGDSTAASGDAATDSAELAAMFAGDSNVSVAMVGTVDGDSLVVDSATAAALVEPEELGAGGFALGVAGILFFTLALPIIVILGSMPGGLISAVIIAIGMRQAWTMTGAQDVTITGPFKIGTEAPPATA